MKSCVTISLVDEARGGPFVFWDDLQTSCQTASELGFDAIEIFAPGPTTVDRTALRSYLSGYSLSLAAVGTGAGWVRHRLHLAQPEAAQRAKAKDFIRSMIEFGGEFKAPAIIGSMQGRSGDGVSHGDALKYLAEALDELGEFASRFGVPLIYEPLNRYETDQVKTVAEGVSLLESLSTTNVVLLCDLFHMNIEERDVAAALRIGGKHVGHIHFVDSNRQAPGFGHIDYLPIITALRDIGYQGCLSAEALSLPDARGAAEQTIRAYRHWLSK